MDPIRLAGATPPPTPVSAPKPMSAEEAAATAQEFEAVFLGQITRMMLESVEMGDEFSGGSGEEIFRGIMAEKLGTEMARNGGVGLAPVVLDHIIRMQGNSNGQ